MNVELFINLLIGHLTADFLCQSDDWVKNKQEHLLAGSGMWKHSVVVFLTTIIALGCYSGICFCFALGILLTHITIDYLKVKFTRNEPRAFAIDQIAHIAVLIVVAYLLPQCYDWQQWGIVPKGKELLWPLVVCVYLICLSPANYIVREILKYCHVQNGAKADDNSKNESIKLSGILIGSMERFLVLTFILIGNFEAAGLTVAAKSLLRFNDDESPRTEYVLIGTLLSIIIAVVCALIIFKFGMKVPVLKKP